jgi:hypothetical protein
LQPAITNLLLPFGKNSHINCSSFFFDLVSSSFCVLPCCNFVRIAWHIGMGKSPRNKKVKEEEEEVVASRYK